MATEEKKEAKLGCLTLAQDFLLEHWKWTDKEKSSLGNIEEMGNIIKARLANAGCVIAEMYGIKHDKDESKIWSEAQKTFTLQFVSNHGHFVIKFESGKGETLKKLADIIGIEQNFIEKPKSGRYAYNNMLSYLTHIKFAKKYQYAVSEVHTFVGKKYIDHYQENYETWVKGRAERNVKDAKELLNFLKDGLASGNITIIDICMDDEWAKVYALYSDALDKVADKRKNIIDIRKAVQEKTK